MAATRRTHVVRIYSKKADGTNNKSQYVDVEVLDAVAFRIKRGEEVVLVCPAAKAVPYIVDDTGNGLETSPSATSATRRSHVKQVDSSDGKSSILIEVLDALSFRDANGEEWILTMAKPVPYDVSAGGAGAGADATRRTHEEKVSGSTPPKPNPTKDFLTVERSDMIAFRNVRGKELILSMTSHDDGNGDRAETFISSPPNYDPSDDKADVPENKDPHFYVEFVKNPTLKSPLVGSAKVSQGGFWWIRKVKWGGSSYLVLTISATNFSTDGLGVPPHPSFSVTSDDAEIADQPAPTFQDVPPQVSVFTVYFVWPTNGGPPLPTATTWNAVSIFDGANRFFYAEQFAFDQHIQFSQSFPPNPAGGSGIFSSMADAQAYAALYNARFNSGEKVTAWWGPDGGGQSGSFPDGGFLAQVSAVALDTGKVVVGTSGSSTLNAEVLIKLPAGSTDVINFSVDFSNATIANVYGSSYADEPGDYTTLDELYDDQDAKSQEPVLPPDIPSGQTSASTGPITGTAQYVDNDPDGDPDQPPHRISVILTSPGPGDLG